MKQQLGVGGLIELLGSVTSPAQSSKMRASKLPPPHLLLQLKAQVCCSPKVSSTAQSLMWGQGSCNTQRSLWMQTTTPWSPLNTHSLSSCTLKKPVTCCLLSLSLMDTEGSRSVIPGEGGTVLAKVPGDTGEHNQQHPTLFILKFGIHNL